MVITEKIKEKLMKKTKEGIKNCAIPTNKYYIRLFLYDYVLVTYEDMTIKQFEKIVNKIYEEIKEK